ncbi:MAG: hypothetical protein A3C58_02615 [Candidatus Staskawiczbacteria bacterium RIFCSPHIGHO2_02_FULL_34_10]|uniref:GIY-YIG domain-containing protein n=1 Tax=Candidatus Staskawiczbacteria bacterium RIFCSPHIGHO2_02_FULL_34_10 TaxID=1802205 RepID=A0A1G2HVJ5_9BACT|nr:MAG: hypothetical protein A3C58_02615 [Candidatus Staskawiczbacteria bacterium RIFCSPHIGHO2_02_FULL_34_10]
MWFTYIIECKDKTLYTGITKDIKRRFLEHKNKKGAKYTLSHQVDRVVYSESYTSRSGALKRESEIKKWPKKKKAGLFKS